MLLNLRLAEVLGLHQCRQPEKMSSSFAAILDTTSFTMAPKIMTDTSTVLDSVGKGREHHKVNHTVKEYVRYEDGLCITTNAVEGYFATLKRGVNGIYHHVGKQHLHRYLTEFDFRYNARHVTDGERAKLALNGVSGKRLMYRDSKAG